MLLYFLLIVHFASQKARRAGPAALLRAVRPGRRLAQRDPAGARALELIVTFLIAHFPPMVLESGRHCEYSKLIVHFLIMEVDAASGS